MPLVFFKSDTATVIRTRFAALVGAPSGTPAASGHPRRLPTDPASCAVLGVISALVDTTTSAMAGPCPVRTDAHAAAGNGADTAGSHLRPLTAAAGALSLFQNENERGEGRRSSTVQADIVEVPLPVHPDKTFAVACKLRIKAFE